MFEMTLNYASALLALASLGCALSSNPNDLPVGSQRKCLTPKGDRIFPFEVLVGGGWDNLRNKDMAMISAVNYTRCQTTDDGRYLIPDNMYTIPTKSSMVSTYAEMFEHWNNYTSTTSSSINAHAGLHLSHFGISGKFSKGYTSVKMRQYYEKAVTTRVQARYARYTAKLNPGSPLNSEFRRRLRKIAAHINLNRTDSARYESQMIVRDYGTHVVTSVDVGATLTQVDQLHTSFVKKYSSQKNTILASASASFFGIFDFGIDYSKTTTTQMMDEYLKSRTSSEVETYGGPVFKPRNFTSSDWSERIDDDMVAIDRSGEPIYFIINEDTLPDLPASTLANVYDYIKEAIEIYYKQNTYRGCTNPDAPNFSFQANVDDGMCLPTSTNYTFGGVYQSCSSSGYTDLCAKMRQKNPMTGDYSCPAGYEPVMIQDGSKSASTTRRECHRCWIFAHCCDDNTYTASARYTAYWCAATGPVKQNSGYLFGGLYTNAVSNAMTGVSSCPAQYYPLHILDNLFICVSDDYELGTQYSLPFAGFFSCKSGNPLALNGEPGQKNKQTKLMLFMQENRGSPYPHRCPEGYSQHMAVNDRGCEINYCVKSGALTPQGLPAIHLPPFMKIPRDNPQEKTGVVFSDDGTVWTTMEKAKEKFSDPKSITASEGTSNAGNEESSSNSDSDSSVSPGGAAAIAIVATLAFVVTVAVAIKLLKRRRGRAAYNYS